MFAHFMRQNFQRSRKIYEQTESKVKLKSLILLLLSFCSFLSIKQFRYKSYLIEIILTQIK